jgi:hypothetical protein
MDALQVCYGSLFDLGEQIAAQLTSDLLAYKVIRVGCGAG